MAFMRLFKTPKNQQFSYKPRYWDPKKEEAEERRRRIETLQTGGVDGVKERIRGGFRKGAGGEATGRYRNSHVRKSNYSLVIIMAVLVLLSYLLIKMYIPGLQEMLG